jgi:hypothetical protein
MNTDRYRPRRRPPAADVVQLIPVPKVLTRSAVARMLGCTRSGVRYLERIGVLTPEVDAKGVRRFDRAEVDALLGELRRQRPSATLARDGSLAARVFRMFRDGLSFPEIVIKTEESPETIRALFEQYRRPLGEADEEPRAVDDLSDFAKRAREIENEIMDRRKMWRK